MNDKEVRIPVVSHHCRITHSACDCVLRRLKKLEAVAERASKLAKMINRDIPSVERSIGLGNALEYTREALAALEAGK